MLVYTFVIIMVLDRADNNTLGAVSTSYVILGMGKLSVIDAP